MRADLPPAIASAIETCVQPTLLFDRARLVANMHAFVASGATVLFAAKSFPHPEVWQLAAATCAGFDVASVGELAALPATSLVSVADPTGRAGDVARAARVIVSCESAAQVARAPANAEIAIRLSSSYGHRDPAVGAVLDGNGHRRSRFGVETEDELRAIADAARGRRLGLHVHHGPVTAGSGERFASTVRDALARAAGLEIAFLDVGGAWHGVADVGAAIATVRAAVPASIELIVEPGRAIAREAGFAVGRVVAARELADRMLRIVDLSRLGHLRWSPIELVGAAPHAGTGRNVLVVGPTCSEDDVVGEWTITPALLAVGERFIVRGVTGYAVAWNTPFGGVPAADIRIV